uniref:Ig-like domain-containing protein n=1 Tax=Zonotrichia albicollis TaxID=44394 RepID=A0A8D2M0K1_ZONAL
SYCPWRSQLLGSLSHILFFFSSGHNSSSLVMTVGNSSVLNCSFKGNITLLKWTIIPKAGGLCTLVYRICLLPLRLGLAQEGNNSCGVASAEGNFHKRYHLTVLGKECAKVELQGSPVCEAAAGKPPAQLSWAPEGSSTAEERCHDNGTVTVLSKFTACSTRVTNVTTCMVSHPAGNWSQSIACCPSGELPFVLSVFRALISPLFMYQANMSGIGRIATGNVAAEFPVRNFLGGGRINTGTVRTIKPFVKL